MKRISLIITVIAIITSCKNTTTDNVNIKMFLETMGHFEIKDSSKCEYKMTFNYEYKNPETYYFSYNVPDSIKNSDFYNAYASSLISAYYHSINHMDTSLTYSDLLTINSIDSVKVLNKVYDYVCSDPVFCKIFNEAESAFNHQIEAKKKIALDSLISLSLNYFNIAGYYGQFIYHFVCGGLPYEYKCENSTNILIAEFCNEALKNETVNKAQSHIMSIINNEINEEYLYDSTTHKYRKEIVFKNVKKKYNPKLKELLRKNDTLKNSIISYYEQRKDIVSFELVY